MCVEVSIGLKWSGKEREDYEPRATEFMCFSWKLNVCFGEINEQDKCEEEIVNFGKWVPVLTDQGYACQATLF